MYTQLLLPACIAFAAAQGPPPPPVLLTSTESGVVPVAPTPFPGVETEEGAIIFDGPAIPGFTGPGGAAIVQSNLPQATYRADLPSTNFDNLTGSTITGSITGATAANGTGVTFSINFTGFPSEAQFGPFVYHVHNFPVPSDGNCSATIGHLDPTNRGELHACDVTQPATCQAGDLAGKHGNITTPSFSASYTELFLSTDPSSQYFFGDKSVVIHSTNTTRLTCANFVKISGSGSNSTASGTGSPTPSQTATGTSNSSPPFTGAASPILGGGAGMVGGALAAVAALII